MDDNRKEDHMKIVCAIDMDNNVEILQEEEKRIFNYLKLFYAVYGKKSAVPFIYDSGLSYEDYMLCVNNALEKLTEREEKVLRLRFGLDTGETMDAHSVGKIYDVTKARIDQIEGKAIRKLRNPYNTQMLRILFPRNTLCNPEKFASIITEKIKTFLELRPIVSSPKIFKNLGYDIEIEEGLNRKIHYADESLMDIGLSLDAVDYLNQNGIISLEDLLNLNKNQLDLIECLTVEDKLVITDKKRELTENKDLQEDAPKIKEPLCITLKKDNEINLLYFYTSSYEGIARKMYLFLNSKFKLITCKNISDELKMAAIELGYITEDLYKLHLEQIEQFANRYRNIDDKNRNVCTKRIMAVDIKIHKKHEEITNEDILNSLTVKNALGKEPDCLHCSSLTPGAQFMNEEYVFEDELENICLSNRVSRIAVNRILKNMNLDGYSSNRLNEVLSHYSIAEHDDRKTVLKDIIDSLAEYPDKDNVKFLDEIIVDYNLNSEELSYIYNTLIRKLHSSDYKVLNSLMKKEVKLKIKEHYLEYQTIEEEWFFSLMSDYGVKDNQDEYIDYAKDNQFITREECNIFYSKYEADNFIWLKFQ